VQTIAVFNLKGGTAKSTTAVNLGAAWASSGHRTLVLDVDPQGDSTQHLGVDAGGESLYDALVNRTPLEDAVLATSIDDLDLVPGGDALAAVDADTSDNPSRFYLLRSALTRFAETYGGDYEFVLVDCPPSTGMLNISAALAADYALIPVEAQGAAVRGLLRAIERLEEISEFRDVAGIPPIEILGLLVCKYDVRTALSKDADTAVREHYPDLTLETYVNRNTRVAEAYLHGEPVLRFAPDSRGTKDYAAAAKEILGRLT
jgi:chromosome partitioning protein